MRSGGRWALLLIGCGATRTTARHGDGHSPAVARSGAQETAGPFPGDGSNGPNVLTESGVVRRDITKSFGDASGVAEGVPASLDLTLLDVAAGGPPLAGAAVYLWHCDMACRYSLYDDEIAEENFLRGVQETGDDGKLGFDDDLSRGVHRAAGPTSTSRSTRASTPPRRRRPKLRTSQLALPQDVCDPVFATDRLRAERRRTSRRHRWTPTWCSATATRASWRGASGAPGGRFTLTLNVGV